MVMSIPSALEAKDTMSKSKAIRFGIVGCGRIGARHAEHISNNPRAMLVAVCDTIEERADAFAREYGGAALYTLDDLLGQDLDVVSICTPSGMHADMSIKTLEAGNHVLCEKPMTLNLEDCDRVIEAEKKSDKKFFLVKQNRFNKPVKILKDMVFNRRLGRVSLINSDVFWNRNRAYYEKDDWKGTMAQDGGALMTQCSHFLDLMIWIGGKAVSVSARMANLSHDYIETEDTGLITIAFENGAIGSLQYTTSVYRHNFEGSMIVLGTDGTIKIGGQYLNTLEYWDVANTPNPDIGDETPLLPGADGTYKGSMSRHGDVIENVVGVLLDGLEIKTNSHQGRESIEVMQAAYISALEGREVSLPLASADAGFRLNEQAPLSGRSKGG